MATPQNLTILLVALLASDKPSTAVERVKPLLALQPAKGPNSRRCSFTDKDASLLQVIVHILMKFDLAEMPVLTISGTQLLAILSERGPHHTGGMGRTQEYLPFPFRITGPNPKIAKSASFEFDDLAWVMRSEGKT
jgi:hypothetical protein